jgi:ABC-type lipoprotein export system ATPase subunit
MQTNSRNILFCIGPKGSGKTWLIRNHLLDHPKEPTIVINAEHYASMDQFQNAFKETLIERVLAQENINSNHLLGLLLSKNDSNYVNRHFNQELEKISNGEWILPIDAKL